MQLEDSTILVTGGTGSFGRAFADTLLKDYRPAKLIIFSRDELKQHEMQQQCTSTKQTQVRYFIGDVRDRDRLERALEGVDIVVHAAALKQIPAAEYNPFECIKTNVFGAQNVIDAAMHRGVKRVVALSTDKAAAPINLYGATKLCSDKLFVAANNYAGRHDIKLSVVRYGNVMGSRGSVIPFFMEKKKTGVIPITDERMTRFNITLKEGVQLVLKALREMWGGEIFVPKIPSYRINDVAEAVAPQCRREIVGIRPGEKLHEDMITETDGLSAIEFEKHYVIRPSTPIWETADYCKAFGGTPCQFGFRYSSDSNSEWLTVDEIRRLVAENVKPN
jgi:UDP-N-acetylglucosamine 4,6-dehydratase